METVWLAPGQTAPKGAAWFRVAEVGHGYYNLDGNIPVPEELTVGFGVFDDAYQAELAGIEAARRLGRTIVYVVSADD